MMEVIYVKVDLALTHLTGSLSIVKVMPLLYHYITLTNRLLGATVTST